jgi:prolyl oligopeptidase
MKKNILIFIILLYSVSTFAQWHYPYTKTVDSSDTFFGVTYKDPYRWLEHMKNPEVELWYKEQAKLTDSILNNISGRNELIAEWKELDKLQPAKFRNRDFENGRIFYKKTMPGEIVAKVYYREGKNEKETLLFDPLTYIEGKTLSVESILPSYDGKKVAIAYSEGGKEVSTIKIMDVDKKQFYPEIIYPSLGGPISWTFNNQSFTYASQKSGDVMDPQFKLNSKARLHILGKDVKEDVDFFSNERYPELGIKEKDHPYVWLEKDSRNYVFSQLYTVRPEYYMFYASISQFNKEKITWKTLCTAEDQIVRGMEIIGDTVFSITYKNAKNYKLVATSLKNPDWDHPLITIGEKTETLEAITRSKGFLFLTYSNGINNYLYKYNLKTAKITSIKLPFDGVVSIFCLDTKTNLCTVGITSWVKPYMEFEYDAENDGFTPGTFNKPPKYPDAYTNLMVEETEVKGYDGVMIPLTIIYKKGIKLDGSSCCLMDSYGAYGISMDPIF